MRKSKLLNLFLISILFCSYALAQDVGSFSEKNLTDGSLKQDVLPKVSTDEAPINKLEVNKSTIIEKDDSKNSIDSLLLNKGVISLMYDDEQNTNIDRAVDAFKNNQQFVPEETEEQKAANAEKQKNDEDGAKEKDIAKNEKSFVYLASIIYFTANDWAVWINEQKITPSTNRQDKEIYLTSVKSDLIGITWKLSLSKWRILSGQRSDAIAPNLNENNQVVLEFELKPNQTFALAKSKVFEGRAVAALLKKKEAAKTQVSATPTPTQQKQGDVKN